MRIILEPTSEIVEIVPEYGTNPTRIECRVWQGSTDTGVPLRALIALVAVERTGDDAGAGEDQSAFDRELIEKFPTADAPRVFPSRMVL